MLSDSFHFLASVYFIYLFFYLFGIAQLTLTVHDLIGSSHILINTALKYSWEEVKINRTVKGLEKMHMVLGHRYKQGCKVIVVSPESEITCSFWVYKISQYGYSFLFSVSGDYKCNPVLEV